MNRFLKNSVKFFAYLAAGTVILLAVAVGLFRLFLPRLPEYQEEIKTWASDAIGVQVEFSGMDARWGLSGPELEFYDAELIRPDSGAGIVAAEEVRVGVGLVRLLADRKLVVDRVVVRASTIDVVQLEDGSFSIQGSRADDLLNLRAGNAEAPAMDLIGEQLELRYQPAGDVPLQSFSIPRVRVSIDERRVAIDAAVRPPETLGKRLLLSATQLTSLPEAERRWDIAVEADDLNLAGWSGLAPYDRRFVAGLGDMELALAYSDDRVTNVAADIDFVDIALAEGAFFDVSGRVEVDFGTQGWLVAANDLVIATEGGQWPSSSIRVEASTDGNGDIVLLDAVASYLDLDDARLSLPWLTESQQQQFLSWSPSGIVRNLEATLSELGGDEIRYSVAAELERVGIASLDSRPGVRGFSGLLRANQAGGLLEIHTTDMTVDAPKLVGERIDIDTAEGTVIWRRSDDETTVLSDSIHVASEILDSESNLTLKLRDGAAPVVDLSSSWSIADIARAKRFIPRAIMKPKLHDWFQSALVGGSIPSGTTQLKGPLDKFPFDGGEGRLLVNGSVRGLTFKYHKDWPAAEQADLEVVLDNMRLYTEQNRSVSVGNTVVDANVEIPDLRDPVLQIESFSTGTLESIRRFSLDSPIARVFGGQLDRVAVDGEASFTLDLLVPLKRDRIREFEFVSRVRSNNGSLRIDGFPAPITDLTGEVTISRDSVSSEALGGSFLGQPVSIDLADSQDPRYAVVANAEGTLTGDGLVEGLGVPLEGHFVGATPYQVRVLFPRSQTETPAPLTIFAASDLIGLAVDLPEPLGKPADVPLPFSGDMRLLPGGESIESAGTADGRFAWQLTFTRPEGAWDLDRGVVMFGDDAMQAADLRGLHIRGRTDVVRLGDWLSLSRGDAKAFGATDRIRKVDLQIDTLHAFGQRIQGHRVSVDRSAHDWHVRFDGEDVSGSVFVPYEFGGDREVVLDMDRLRLPGDDTAEGAATDLDPRSLPPMTLEAREFAFGDRYLGAVRATLVKVEGGLEATAFESKDPSFGIVGSGRWLADESDALGSRSFVAATLDSTDVSETMARLNYEPGIVSDSMRIEFDLNWSGGPRADFFDVLGGDVEVRLGSGSLEEVEPGAGRMFGLMSIVALPRRLALDFRDVFNKGFGFDEITGSFRIVDGRTYTCNLSLDGPAADIGIVGETDLANRSYNQTAVVSANVGNTLPIVGAVVAGPQAAAALLIFSQIFKKPLQEVGQVYYGISGSWDEPVVDSTNSEAFVASSELAGCLESTE